MRVRLYSALRSDRVDHYRVLVTVLTLLEDLGGCVPWYCTVFLTCYEYVALQHCTSRYLEVGRQTSNKPWIILESDLFFVVPQWLYCISLSNDASGNERKVLDVEL